MVAISVVLPTRCTSERPAWGLLRRAVGSWLNQSLADDHYEVIVVDRASDPAVKLALPVFDQRLQVVRTEGTGLCHAYNLGLQQARGRYIYLAGDDSIADPTALEAHLRQHADRDDLIVWGRVVRLQADAGRDPGSGGWLQELDDASGFAGLLAGCALVEGHLDIEERINERFFERSRLGWLVMGLGHQSCAASALCRVSGFDEGLDPLGWYAAQDLGIRLRSAGLYMITQRRHPVIHVPFETMDEYVGHDLAYFVHLFRQHRLPELLLLERYFRDRLPLLELESLVEQLGLPTRS
jgi:glycosyltransferase involved in cell wall biosynthesis